MKKLFFLLVIILHSSFSKAQVNAKIDGFMLSDVPNVVRVYQETFTAGATPTFGISMFYKFWNPVHWFYTGNTISINNIQYVELFIPDGGTLSYGTAWAASGGFISRSDFDTWLLISKSDYDALNKPHYLTYNWSFVTSAVTIPFKIHPPTGERQASLFNANFSVGTLLGIRLGIKNTFGITAGPFFGIALLEQNSSNNSGIVDKTNQTMAAANYGLGIVVDISRKIQLGGAWGRDYGFGDLNTTYAYQEKNWYAVSFNFKFIDYGLKEDKGQ